MKKFVRTENNLFSLIIIILALCILRAPDASAQTEQEATPQTTTPEERAEENATPDVSEETETDDSEPMETNEVIIEAPPQPEDEQVTPPETIHTDQNAEKIIELNNTAPEIQARTLLLEEEQQRLEELEAEYNATVGETTPPPQRDPQDTSDYEENNKEIVEPVASIDQEGGEQEGDTNVQDQQTLLEEQQQRLLELESEYNETLDETTTQPQPQQDFQDIQDTSGFEEYEEADEAEIKDTNAADADIQDQTLLEQQQRLSELESEYKEYLLEEDTTTSEEEPLPDYLVSDDYIDYIGGEGEDDDNASSSTPQDQQALLEQQQRLSELESEYKEYILEEDTTTSEEPQPDSLDSGDYIDFEAEGEGEVEVVEEDVDEDNTSASTPQVPQALLKERQRLSELELEYKRVFDEIISQPQQDFIVVEEDTQSTEEHLVTTLREDTLASPSRSEDLEQSPEKDVKGLKPEGNVDLLGTADGLYKLSQFQAALEIYQTINLEESSDQDKSWILYQIGNCYRNLKQFDDAQSTYQQLMAEFPETYPGEAARWYFEDLNWWRQWYEPANVAISIKGKIKP